MNRFYQIFTITLALFFITEISKAQFTFSVSPGLSLNSSYFGYSVNNKIIPFIGFQHLGLNAKTTETGEEFDNISGLLTDYEREYKFSGNLYIPTLGLKYFAMQKDKIKLYGTLSISKPIISGKIEDDGETDEYFEEDVESLSIWGGELGIGAEYFFDDSFSIGGEFGFRYFYLNVTEKYDRTIYNPNTGMQQETEVEYKYNFNFSPTFTKISLNYYFGKSEE